MWTLNVRFPESLKAEVEEAIRILNSRPDRIGEIKKNDLIVYAVQRTCRAIIENANNDAQADEHPKRESRPLAAVR